MQLFSAPNIIFSLGLMIIGVAKFLDGHTDENWRKRLAAFLRTGKIGGESDRRSKAVKPWQFAAKTMSSFFRDILRSEDAWHFLSLSGAASIVIIIIAFFYFYMSGNSYDQDQILALFGSTKTVFFALIIHLLATLFIDFIAAYQTIFFVEMVGKCGAVWQVFVLIYGNVLLSLGLFSFAFPLVVVGSLLVENLQTYRGTISYRPISTAQSESRTEAALFYTFGGSTSDGFSREDTGRTVVWQINTTTLNESQRATVVMSTVALSSAKFSATELMAFISDAIQKRGSELHMEITKQTQVPGFFYNLPGLDLNVRVRDAFHSLPITSLYRIAFVYTSLLGVRSLEIIRGRPVTMETSNAVPALADEVNSLGEGSLVFLCDGDISRIPQTGSDLAGKLKKCSKWAAIRSSVFNAEAVMLTSEDTSRIFIAPFALSSLSMTFLVYTVCIVLLYTAAVRAVMPRLFGWNFLQVEKIPLTLAASVMFVFFIVPLATLALIL